jgi:hypothetical protein
MAATTLRKSLRTSDYAFRIGGDEFAILLPQSDTEQAATLSRRLRAAYAAAIEPLRLGIPLGLDYGLAVYPDDGEQQEIMIRVADERLYQLKNSGRTSATAAGPSAKARPQIPPEKETLAGGEPEAEPSPIPDAARSGKERRRWERVSLVGTKAYALIGEGVERTARVVDLGYGGVALEITRSEDLDEAFHAVLHVPILPPVRVNLRRVYMGQGSTGSARVGCSFVT